MPGINISIKMEKDLISIKWPNHSKGLFRRLSSLRQKQSYCDATISCEGKFIGVHRLVVSMCSEYLEEMFDHVAGLGHMLAHPVVVLPDIKHKDLEALLDYIYVGETEVGSHQLPGILKAAKVLKIIGLHSMNDMNIVKLSRDQPLKKDNDPVEIGDLSAINNEQTVEMSTKSTMDLSFSDGITFGSVPSEDGNRTIGSSGYSNDQITLESSGTLVPERLSERDSDNVNGSALDTTLYYIADSSVKYNIPSNLADDWKSYVPLETKEIQLPKTNTEADDLQSNSEIKAENIPAEDIEKGTLNQDLDNRKVRFSEMHESFSASDDSSSGLSGLSCIECISADSLLRAVSMADPGEWLLADAESDSKVSCLFCSKKIPQSEFQAHCKTHSLQKPVCTHIPKTVQTKNYKMVPVEERIHPCPKCSQRFAHKMSMKLHIFKYHLHDTPLSGKVKNSRA